MKLKKKYANILKLIILLLIITIIIIIVMRLIKKDHVVDYKINNYNIHEKFYIKDKKHYYEFAIKDSKDIFVFNYKKNVHKKKRIIKKIIVSNYKKNKCIMPIYGQYYFFCVVKFLYFHDFIWYKQSIHNKKILNI